MVKTINQLAEEKTSFYNKEELTDYERNRIKETEQEKQLDDEYLNDNNNHYKGIFVEVLKEYQRKKTKLIISTFNKRNIRCIVLKSDVRSVKLKSLLNGKIIYLTQVGIKDIEEI